MFVDLIPPPHEREWRHPAEISAEHRILFAAEPPSRRLKVVALVIGACSLIAAMATALFITALG
jgi:hypothetical protein